MTKDRAILKYVFAAIFFLGEVISVRAMAVNVRCIPELANLNFAATIQGEEFSVVSRSDDKVLMKFNVGEPIEHVEIVEYTHHDGYYKDQDTMAVVVTKNRLMAIEVNKYRPHILSQMTFTDQILGLEIKRQTHPVTVTGVQFSLNSIVGRVHFLGKAEYQVVTMDEGNIKPLSE